MNINGINNAAIQGVGSTTPAKPAVTVDGGFGQMLTRYIDSVNTKQLKADEILLDFATGKEQNVHNVVLAETEADLSFRMLTQTRNKLVEAYKEVMRMQI